MEMVADFVPAAQRIAPYIRETWLVHSPFFSDSTNANVYMKLENLQHTGSFKVRGALNKLLSLSEKERRFSIVTASSGNHGAAVAYAMQITGLKGTVFVPENVSEAKVQNIRSIGGSTIEFHGFDSSHTEVAARAYAERHDCIYVPPYNDATVIAGQGTLGIEMLNQLPTVDVVLVAIGGGGLISGVATYLKTQHPNIKIVGVSPAASQVMIQSIHAGRILDLPSEPTLSDGTAGGVESGAITFDLIQRYVDELVTVTESDIARAMREFMTSHHMLIEGAAGVALAGLSACREQLEGKNVAVIVCGANISLPTLKRVL